MVHMHGEGTLTIGVSVRADGVVTQGPTDSLGLPITKTYKITASELGGQTPYHYELGDPDGNVLVSGVGNELTDALLGFAIGIEANENDSTITMPDAAPRTCSDCGRDLEDLSQPCPNCGSTRQTTYLHTGGSTTPSGAVTEYTVTYSGDRPWFGRWYGVRQELEKVEAECRPEAYRGGLYIVAAFENFFWQCLHLGDALWEDKSTGLSEQKVIRFIQGDPDLSKCEAMASTSKHHKRHPQRITARVHTITTPPNGSRATIRWEQGPNAGTEDALDLARRCVAAWERYLQRNGLQSPI
jgi:hypothetical protein